MKTETQNQFIIVARQELVDLFTESLKTQNQELLNVLKETQPIKEEKDFLTRKETANLFKVSLVTIHEWQNNGTIKVYKMGNRSYYKRSELLETLFNSNRH